MRKYLPTKLLAWGAVLMVCLGVSTAHSTNRTLNLEIGKSIVLPTNGVVLESVFVADDSIVDGNVSASDEVFLYGKSVGETNVILSTQDGRTLDFTIVVSHNLTELRRSIAARFPGENVQFRSARGTLQVGGTVSSEGKRQAILTTLRGIISDSEIVDQMIVSQNNLVRLKVRVLEINLSRVQDFGIDWDLTIANNGFFFSSSNQGLLEFGFSPSLGASSSFSATLNLLIDNNVASIVQETTLAVVNGERAKFRVGSEFPVPQFSGVSEDSQGSNFSIEYRFVGTTLEFSPTFTAGERLRLDIASTVSEVLEEFTEINGNEFPNTTFRSFSTKVDLEDGQPFAIAGLSRDATVDLFRDSSGTILSDAANTVFGADNTRSSRQELVIIVTPILSSPVEKTVEHKLIRPVSNLAHILSTKFPLPGGTIKSSPTEPELSGFQY